MMTDFEASEGEDAYIIPPCISNPKIKSIEDACDICATYMTLKPKASWQKKLRSSAKYRMMKAFASMT